MPMCDWSSDVCSSDLLFDHFQFALIHGSDIPGSYAILLFTALDLASITSHIHSWVLFLLWLHPFMGYSSWVAKSRTRLKCLSSLAGEQRIIIKPGKATQGSEVIVAQSCPTLCDHMDYTVHGILQARILEWVAFPFSRGPEPHHLSSFSPRDRDRSVDSPAMSGRGSRPFQRA